MIFSQVVRESDYLVPMTKSQPQSTYFSRDEAGLVCLPTQLERTLQLYW